MTRRRWMADEIRGNTAALTGDHAAHLVKVLRARVGQEFDISAGKVARRGRIVSLAEDRVEFELGEEISESPSAGITVVLSIFKFDRLEWAIEKCTELGVARIIPVIARRTDTHLEAASTKRVERWRRLALQASEQSRRSSTPEIDAPLKLADAMKLASSGVRIVLSESETELKLRDLLAAHASPRADLESAVPEIALAIGPEGGWTEDELRAFQQAGWICASLGAQSLRAETAAIAATAIVLSQLE